MKRPKDKIRGNGKSCERGGEHPMNGEKDKNGRNREDARPVIIEAKSVEGKTISKNLDENMRMIRDMFFNDDTVIVRTFGSQNNDSLRCCIVMVDGMVAHDVTNFHIMEPIIRLRPLQPFEDPFEVIYEKAVSVGEVKTATEFSQFAASIVSGETVLFLDGCAKAMIINTRGWMMRSVQEPEPEKVIRGPREGFVESILISLSMIRRKIASPDLKFKFKTIGARTHTKICIVYHEALVNHDILNEVVKRINRFDLDGALDAEYVEEMIRDAPYSPFQTVGSTERPDIVAAKLLEVLDVHGSKFGLLHEALGDDDGVLVVSARPAHEGDADVLSERHLALV